jgi:ribosomal protein S18 acetylase RimI-like enzyme
MGTHRIREGRTSDIPWIMQNATELPYLQCHTEHTYWILLEYGRRYVLVAEDETGTRVGFVSGVRSTTDPKLFFLWQLAVLPGKQRGGLGHELVDAFFDRVEGDGGPGTTVNAAMDSDNAPVHVLLRRWAANTGHVWRVGEKISYVSYEAGQTKNVEESIYVIQRREAAE